MKMSDTRKGPVGSEKNRVFFFSKDLFETESLPKIIHVG